MRWVAGLLSLLLLGAWLASGFLRVSSDVPGPQVEGQLPRIGDPPELVASELSAGPAGETRQEAAAEGEQDWWSEWAVYGPPEWPLIHGQVVVVDPQGEEHEGLSGSFQLVVWEGSSGECREVLVDRGRWLSKIPPGSQLSFDLMRLGDRLGALEGDPYHRFEIPPDGELDLRVHWPRVTVIDARDAFTGASLSEVELLRSCDVKWSFPETPGAVVDSPVELTADLIDGIGNYETYWVRSEGYAWTRVEVDTQHGGRFVVELAPGGDLELTLKHDRLDSNTWLESIVSACFILRPIHPGENPLVLRSLPAGPLLLIAFAGSPAGESHRLGRVEVEIIPRAMNRVTLTLDNPPPQELGSIEGDLLLPLAWGIEDPKVALFFEGPALSGAESYADVRARKVGPDPEHWTWHTREMPSGIYKVRMEGIAFTTHITAGGATRPRIEVPPPIDLSVYVEDAVTGARLEGGEAELGFSNEEESFYSGSLPWDPSTGAYTGRVPMTPIEVGAEGPRHRVAIQMIDPRPGQNVLTMKLEPGTGVIFTARLDGRPVTSWYDSDLEVYSESDEPPKFFRRERLHLLLPGPGTYRFGLLHPPKVLPIEPFELVVTEGMTEHVLDLRTVR